MAGKPSLLGPILDPAMSEVHAVVPETLTCSEVERALIVHDIACGLQDEYEHLLRAMVFPRLIADRKDTISFRRTLLSYETYPILRVIWKESPCVTDAELKALNFQRIFPADTLSCHAFAEQIAERDDAGEVDERIVGKVNKRIGTIIDAGSACGLIEKRKIRRNMILLVGSELLHDFMIELSRKQCARILNGKRGIFLAKVNQL
jgi:hypothetical protein